MHKEHESYGRNDAQFVVTQRKKNTAPELSVGAV